MVKDGSAVGSRDLTNSEINNGASLYWKIER